MTSQQTTNIPNIVIVGGGAGGFELAAMLGKKLGKSNKATITLVDVAETHVWKPLLHEVAAGSLNSNEDEINYLAYASSHYFHFSQGEMINLNRAKKEIYLAKILNNKNEIIIPERTIAYDILIIAVGSVANDFAIPGVREYCYFLDNREQADYFHRSLINRLTQLAFQQPPATAFNIAIVGAGATGIELAAELHNAVRVIAEYGVEINPAIISITLIEAADKLLPALPSKLSSLVRDELQRLNITLLLNEQVTQVTLEGLKTKSDKFIPADIKIWTAGIKAPAFLANLDGLKVNRLNQLIVKQTLQTTDDDSIFAFGDCASCPRNNTDLTVPPRAQSAHQQAKFLVTAISDYLNGKPLPLYQYRDYGSLVAMSRYNIVGNLMGRITNSFLIEGWIARFVYFSLYRKHQSALYGIWRVLLLTIANFLSKRVKPRLKLH